MDKKRSKQEDARDSGVVAQGVTDLRESGDSRGFVARYLSLARSHVISHDFQSLARPEKKLIEIQNVRNKAVTYKCLVRTKGEN